METDFYPECHGSFVVLLFASTSQLRYITVIIQLSLKKPQTAGFMRHSILERNFYSAFESDSFECYSYFIRLFFIILLDRQCNSCVLPTLVSMLIK